MSRASNLPLTDLARYRGDSSALSIPLTDPDTGAAFTPNAETDVFLFTIKADAAADADAAALCQKSSAVGGLTVANPAIATLVPGDFGDTGLRSAVTYEFDLQVQRGDGAPKTLAKGTVYFEQDVTRELSLSIATLVVQPSSSYLNAQQLEAYKNAAEAAEATATEQAGIATAAADQTATDAAATAADRVQTGLDRTQTGLDAAATAADRSATHSDKLAADADAAATAADRIATGLDVLATAADRVQTGLDRTQTGLDAASALDSKIAAANSALAAAAVGVSLVAPHLAGRGPRGGIVSTGSTYVGRTEDNPGLALATGDLTLGLFLELPDFTPAAIRYLVTKFASNLGLKAQLLTTGVVRVEFGNGSNFSTYRFDSTAAIGVTDLNFCFLLVKLDRDGNMTVKVNAVPLGNTVAISAAAAQTLTSTGPLLWSSDGSTHTAGALGEGWIISGLTTDAQDAAIFAAGSIEPFAASFTFFARPYFGQGYGPIIRDWSGNGQHALMGASGLSHAVPRNPPGIPQRAPQTALLVDDVVQLRALLGAHDPAALGFTLWSDFVFPGLLGADVLPASNLATIGPGSNLGASQAAGFSFSANTGAAGDFGATAWGSSSSNYRAKRIAANAHLLFGGRRMVFVATLTPAGVLELYIGLDGDFFRATNLFPEITVGTPPAWADALTGTYLNAIRHGSTTAFRGAYFDLRFCRGYALTEAELREEYLAGQPTAKFRWGSITPTYTSNFTTAATDGWTSGDGTTAVTGNIDQDADATGVPPSNDWAKFQNSGLNGQMYSNHSSLCQIGRKYRYEADVFCESNNLTSNGLYLCIGRVTNRASYGGVLFAADATAKLDVVFTAEAENVLLGVTTGPTNNTGMGHSPSSNVLNQRFYLKNIKVTPVGWNTRLNLASAGLERLDDSPNKLDFALDAGKWSTSPDQRIGYLRFRTSTNGNQQLLGVAAIDTSKNWKIRSITSTPVTGTPTITHGSASGGAQYVASVALAAGQNHLALVTTKPATANWWVGSNTTDPIDHTVILDLQD